MIMIIIDPLHQKRPAPSSAKKTGSIFSKKDRLHLQPKRPAPSAKKTGSVFATAVAAGRRDRHRWLHLLPRMKIKTSSVFSKKDRLRLQQKRPAPSSTKKTGSVFSKKNTGYLRMPTYSSRLSGFRSDT